MAEKNTTANRVGLRLLAGLLALLLLGLWFWGARAGDFYHAESNEAGYTQGYADAADKTALAGLQIAHGLALRNLYPGRYTLTVRYAAAGAGGSFAAVDAEDGAVLAAGAYAPGQTETSVQFALAAPQAWFAVDSTLAAEAGSTLEITGYTLTSDAPVFTDRFWLLGLLALFGLALWRCLQKYRAGRRRPLQLLVLAATASLPFLTNHLQYGMDLEFHLSRIYGIAMGLRGGQFPVLLNLDFLNGGYVSPVMYPELFLYPSGVMCLAGASVLLACKVLLIATTFATVFVAYASMRRLLGDQGGLVFALLYTLNPYRMNDIFTRGALGEALAMVFLPLAAVGIWQLVQGNYRRGFWSAALGITGVLQSHIISTFLVLVFGVLYGLTVLVLHGRAFFADLRRLGTILAAALTTVLLNLWFLVPFLHYSGWDFNIFHEKGYLDTASVYLPQAFMDSYGILGDNYDTTTTGEMPLSVGLVLLIGVLVFLYYLLARPGRLTPHLRRTGLACLALGTLALFMSSSLFPWAQLQTIPVIAATFCKMQFAWRALMLVCVLYSAVTAIILVQLWQDKQAVPVGVMLTLLTLTALNAASGYLNVNPCTLPDSSADWNHDYLYQGQYLLTESDFGAVGFQMRTAGVRTESSAAVLGWAKDGTSIDFQFEHYDSGTAAVFRLPLYDYGLYTATLDTGEALAITRDDRYQLVCVTVPAGVTEGSVRVRQYTPLRYRAAELISLAATLGLAALRLRRRKHRARKAPKPA